MAGKKKEAKSDKELSRANSLPSSFGRLPPDNGDSSIRRISYHLAKDTSCAASLNDEIFLKWRTAVAERMFKRDLYRFAVKDEWYGATTSLCHKLAHMVRTQLTANGDTALHIAVSANSVNFVQGLVNLVHMTPQDLEIPNSDGNTAFCVAAVSGNARLLKIMMGKNGNLPLIYRQDGMLPVHLAASSSHHEIVRPLSSDDLLGKMAHNDIKRLFFMTISSDIYAAEYQSDETQSRLNTKMQTRLAWFKELEKRVPGDLRIMKNREGKTPNDILYANHKQLSKDDKETVKGIANSSMLVAALIATVAFAAALTVPGDKTSAWFVVFILTNAVALLIWGLCYSSSLLSQWLCLLLQHLFLFLVTHSSGLHMLWFHWVFYQYSRFLFFGLNMSIVCLTTSSGLDISCHVYPTKNKL